MYRVFSAFLIAVLIVGCQTPEHRENLARHTTPLYDPYEAATAGTLEAGTSGKIFIEGPTYPMLASPDKVYGISIRTTQGGAPRVLFYPDAGFHSIKTGNSTVFVINGAQLKNLAKLEVQVISDSALGKSFPEAVATGDAVSRTFNVEQPLEPQPADGSSASPEAPGGNPLFKLSTKLCVMPQELAADEFGEFFAQAFYVCEAYFENNSLEPLLLYGASVEADVRYLLSEKDVFEKYPEEFKDNPEQFTAATTVGGERVFDALNWTETRRPMSFSDVLGIFDYRRLGDPRQRSLDVLKFAGALAAGASVFVARPDYGEGVAYFTGIFVPEFEKLLMWDVLLHLKYLERRSLKEVQEVPAGGMVHGIVFFPRLPILGINPTKPVYISEIKAKTASASAIAISKLGTTKEDRDKAVAAMLARVAVESAPDATETQAYKDAIDALAKGAERRKQERIQEEAKKQERDKERQDLMNKWTPIVEGIIKQRLQSN